ncbi:hypothetical protein ACROAE_19805 [Shewanella sp. MF05960]|uniref:hypothetical protein n=1 Tax=Shewanella sp. MF05960 TaxID=3434874 RepID=UPI003D7B82CD
MAGWLATQMNHNIFIRRIHEYKIYCCFSIFLIFTGLFSCTEVTSPACRGAYSSVGDKESISELVKEFKRAIQLVRSNGNMILLGQASEVKRDFVSMEEWVCKVHKTYGRL